MRESVRKLECMDVRAWRAPSKNEMADYFAKVRKQHEDEKEPKVFKSILAFRQQFSPVDIYCYLKARFGEPNGFQNRLRTDSSNNWIHWDFNLKATNEDVYICGTYREVHFMLSEELNDEDWRDLALTIKSDYARVGKEKSAVLNSLEKWAIFPNKFVEIATVCADLHADIADCRTLAPYNFPPNSSDKSGTEQEVTRKALEQHYSKLYRNCLELSLMTPVLAEAFINMAILILCKEEIRTNPRQFDAFIRSHIDTKIFDLPYKCEGFTKKIDPNTTAYKQFKRVMDKRNHAIHGNIDPEREQTEVVYFEGKRPLFKEPGDHIAKYFETVAKQHEPEQVVKDYEDVYEFLCSIASCLRPGLQEQFWQIMEDRYPGYDLRRHITGVLLPEFMATVLMQGVRYDDELTVDWSKPTAGNP
jgi:hypothetical protein